MTSSLVICRSRSNDYLITSSKNLSIGQVHKSQSTSIINSTVYRSSSTFSLEREEKNSNLIESSSLSTDVNAKDYFRKSNSLDSGYKTLSAASHGTSHSDPIDEENERPENFLAIPSSPSSTSSSSFVPSNPIVNDEKSSTKIEFVVDDDDENEEKQLEKYSKSNSDGKFPFR